VILASGEFRHTNLFTGLLQQQFELSGIGLHVDIAAAAVGTCDLRLTRF